MGNEPRLTIVPTNDVADVALARDDSPAHPTTSQRLGLSSLDHIAAAAFFEGNKEQFFELVRGCAESLVGDDKEEARQRLLAREIAIEKCGRDLLLAAVGDSAREGNEKAAVLLDKLTTSSTRRLTWLLAEHRAACSSNTRPTLVAIGHADFVGVSDAK
jgi:hypothetical protein